MAPPSPAAARIRIAPDPERPGWLLWAPGLGGFNAALGQISFRGDGDGARCRLQPSAALGNVHGVVHGGAILAFADIALFAGAVGCGIAAATSAVTVDMGAQFLAPGRADAPLDAVVEVLRETGRLVFLRGIVEQGGGGQTEGTVRIAAFTGVIRKLRA